MTNSFDLTSSTISKGHITSGVRFDIIEKVLNSSHVLRAPTVKVTVFLCRDSKGSVGYQGSSLFLPLWSMWYLVRLRFDTWVLIRVSIKSEAEWLYVTKPPTMMTSPSLVFFLHISLFPMLNVVL